MKKVRNPLNKFQWITEEELNTQQNLIQSSNTDKIEIPVEKTETDFINNLGESTEQDFLQPDPEPIVNEVSEPVNKSFFGKITDSVIPEREIDEVKISSDNLNAKSKASAVMSVAVLSLLVDGVCWYLNPTNKEEDRYKPKKAAIEAMENAFFEVYKLHDGVMSPYALLALAVVGGYAPIIFLAYRDGKGNKVGDKEKERIINTGARASVGANQYHIPGTKKRGRPKKIDTIIKDSEI